MRRTLSLLLFGIYTPTIVPVLAAGLPRGVGPELSMSVYRRNAPTTNVTIASVARFFTGKNNFSCINHPEIKLRNEQVNDNTCNCPDGSDEPGTAACAYLDALSPPQPNGGSKTGFTNANNALPGFWCANKGHIGSYVPFMLLNDGHCDYDLCCDGSEEYDHVGGIDCENRCAEMNKEYHRIESARKTAIEKSTRRYKSMAEEAKELRRRIEAKANALEIDYTKLQTRKNELEQKLREMERLEKGKTVEVSKPNGKLSNMLAMAKTRVAELHETFEAAVAHRQELENRVKGLESILSRFKDDYNPNFNDEGVKRAVRDWEDYIAKLASESSSSSLDANIQKALAVNTGVSGINWEDFEESEALPDSNTYHSGSTREFIHQKIDSALAWMTRWGFLADDTKPRGESQPLKAAREAVSSIDSDLAEKKRQVDSEHEELRKDYGTDDVFRVLNKGCVSAEFGEYEYELCWMDKTTQKPKKGGGATNMGRFARIDREVADEDERTDGKGLGKGTRMVLRYEHGQACWNGPQRRTDVWLACSETDELWRVLEWDKCVYRMEVGTPAACGELLAINQPEAKDEL
ncbi:putative glucosidase II beta subunit-like protein [Paramyrothecium foliicola]|nr:putative glucosidase II beta subunit-like protein [Paramyrothecium foliicola]